MKNKTTAALLAFLLGGIGVHKFYLGRPGMGLLYLLFCLTGIPSVVAFIESIMLIFMNEHDFNLKYNPGHMVASAAAPQQIAQSVVVNMPDSSAPKPNNQGDMVVQLGKLNELRTQGVLTEEEFSQQKQKLLASG